MIIAIDGPSGAGKGTLARAIAASLGYPHLDTGAMYRAVALKALRDGVSLDDEPAVTGVAEGARIGALDGHVTLDGEDVGRAIRTPEIDRAAAAVAKLPRVRAVLVERQRQAGALHALVIEGRDIGTVVFPQADVKIYLDAAPGERAKRRAADPAHSSGQAAEVGEVATALEARDRSDQTRSVSPLQRAADAVRIDTTGRSVDDVVAEVLGLLREKMRTED